MTSYRLAAAGSCESCDCLRKALASAATPRRPHSAPHLPLKADLRHCGGTTLNCSSCSQLLSYLCSQICSSFLFRDDSDSLPFWKHANGCSLADMRSVSDTFGVCLMKPLASIGHRRGQSIHLGDCFLLIVA